jgi:hypothetical protein
MSQEMTDKTGNNDNDNEKNRFYVNTKLIPKENEVNSKRVK